MASPRLLIVGPGAMGCGMAALLKQRGADVSLLDYRPDRARQISELGIRVEHEGQQTVVHVPCAAEPTRLGMSDVVIILVKAYATDKAIQHALPCVGPQTAVLTLQNGLGNWQTLAQHVPVAQVLAGTIVMGCASGGVGQVRISGVGEIAVGSPAGKAGWAETVVTALRPYWPQVKYEQDVGAVLWRKAIINAAINPLTALTGLRNGALTEDSGLRETLMAVVEEGRRIADFCGWLPFGDENPATVVVQVCRLTADNQSSMLQDVRARRRTEIDQICGELLRHGQMRGVRTPVLQAVTALVRGLERGYLTSDGE